MLKMFRRRGQKIRIGDEITVCVLETIDGYTRIGVVAPREIKIMRGEIYDRKKPKVKTEFEVPHAEI